jgi:hypothetical protein
MYKNITEQYNCSAFHVYKLAHGKLAMNANDEYIMKVLVKKGIVSYIIKY